MLLAHTLLLTVVQNGDHQGKRLVRGNIYNNDGDTAIHFTHRRSKHDRNISLVPNRCDVGMCDDGDRHDRRSDG